MKTDILYRLLNQGYINMKELFIILDIVDENNNDNFIKKEITTVEEIPWVSTNSYQYKINENND